MALTSGKSLPTWHNLIYSGVSASIAAVVSNPIDVAKTRLQLQGELCKDRLNTGVLNCIRKTYVVEGLLGLQRGLSTAVGREATLNFFRIGLFEPILKIIHTDETSPPFIKRIFAGLVASLIGAVASNPFDLLKTRLQSQALGSNAVVGYQHGYATLRDGFSRILRQEGPLGLWQGTSAAALRQAVGGTTQVTSYSMIKDSFISHRFADTPTTHLASSVATSAVTVTVMNPVDVVRTRIYNQPGGKERSYEGIRDAFVKIVRREGVRGLYKGLTASFMRLTPHTSITFLVLEQLKKWRPIDAGLKYL